MSKFLFHADLAITPSDLPIVKDLLEIIMGDDTRPTHRLEVFSRLCGYGSWAALKAEIDGNAANKRSAPTLLCNRPKLDDSFLASLPREQKRRLAELDSPGIPALVGAGMSMAWHPLYGDIGLPDGLTRALLVKAAMEAPFAPRAQHGLFDHAVIVVSPQNCAEIIEARIEEHAHIPVDTRLDHDLPWIFGRVSLEDEDARAFDVPAEIVESHRPGCEKFRSLADGSCVIFFSEDDQKAFQAQAKKNGYHLSSGVCASLKAEALNMESEKAGDFYSIGYYGTARNDLPEKLQDMSSDFFFNWGFEIYNVVHGYFYEFDRIYD